MLEIDSLYVAYHGQEILMDISISIRPGEILAVVGPNGVGKSTLIRAISGVHPLRSGRVRVAGMDLSSLTTLQRSRYLAVVPQDRLLPAAFTVWQTVLLGRTPYLGWLGRVTEADKKIIQRAMQMTYTTSLANRRLGELSGGEQQRVLLARALAQDAPILLLDEPTTHLDLQHESGLLNLVRSLVQEKKLALLMVLHDLNLAGLYADRIALLADGRLHSVGEPFQVLTEENLSSVYHVPVHIIPHPDYGTPLVLPDGRVASGEFMTPPALSWQGFELGAKEIQ